MLRPDEIGPDEARPLLRSEFDRLVLLGVFEDERVELLEGVLVRMSPIGPMHSSVVQKLAYLLLPALIGRATVRVQLPFAASSRSEPEPDAAVVPEGDYDQDHPSEAWLIVEVAESSLAKDRTAKARLYAGSGVGEYWIVNVIDRQIEVHTDIVRGAYSRVIPYRRGEAITLLRFPDVVVEVSTLLK